MPKKIKVEVKPHIQRLRMFYVDEFGRTKEIADTAEFNDLYNLI